MALCLAHAAAGYLAYEALRPSPGRHDVGLLATAVVCANLPDVDFLPGLALGEPTAFHRGPTHSLLAAVVVMAIAWAVVRWRGSARVSALPAVAGAAYLSHLLLDWMTVDAAPDGGVRLLWPISDAWLHAGWSVLGEVVVDSRSRLGFVRSLLTPTALEVWATEVGVLFATVALVHLARGLFGLRDVVAANDDEIVASGKSWEGQGDA